MFIIKDSSIDCLMDCFQVTCGSSGWRTHQEPSELSVLSLPFSFFYHTMEIFIFSVCHPSKLRAPASEISLKPAHVQKLEIICKALMGSKGRRRRLVNRKVQARQKNRNARDFKHCSHGHDQYFIWCLPSGFCVMRSSSGAILGY